MRSRILVFVLASLGLLLAVLLLSGRDETGPGETLTVAPEGAEKVDLSQAKKVLNHITPETRAVPMARGDVKERLQITAVNRLGTGLDDELTEELSAMVMELGSLARQAKEAAGKGQEPYTPENQLRFMTLLIEGDQAFKENLGIGLSDFLEGLDRGELEGLLVGNGSSESSDY